MKNILVVSVNWLGDVIFSAPVYHALKARYPQARITALGVPRVADVLSLCPDIDDVMVYDEDREDRPLVRKIALIREIRRRQFDAVFILRRSFSRTLLTWLAGIPVRIGFADLWWKGLLTTVVDDKDQDQLHRSDVYLKTIESVGIPILDRACRLAASRDGVCFAKAWLARHEVRDGERLIMINTGGNWDLKQWPWERFAELVRAVTAEGLGRVILTGGSKDVERVGKIAQLSGVLPLICAGETSLAELAGIFSGGHVLITADSGPLHLANALGTDVIALFGPTRPEITGPRGLGRSVVIQKDAGCNRAPCYYLECPDNRCMKMIEVKDVLQALRTL